MTDWPEIFTKIALNRAIHPYQDLRQLGDVGGDAAGFVAQACQPDL